MCQAPVGKVIEVGNDTITIEYNGNRRVLKSRFIDAKPGEYILFSVDIAIDKVDKEEAEMIMKGMK